MPKKALRRELLTRRSALSNADWQVASHAAQKRLLEQHVFQQATSVALYAPLKHEIDTTLLFAAARQAGKRVLYPLVCGETLRFHQISSVEQLAAGSFGILEPCPVAGGTDTNHVDLMVVPGVAFDLRGHRVGFGKGYYDRYLAALDRLPVLVGLCHDFQLCDEVPSEGHDIRMDYVVTESRIVPMAVTDRS